MPDAPATGEGQELQVRDSGKRAKSPFLAAVDAPRPRRRLVALRSLQPAALASLDEPRGNCVEEEALTRKPRRAARDGPSCIVGLERHEESLRRYEDAHSVVNLVRPAKSSAEPAKACIRPHSEATDRVARRPPGGRRSASARGRRPRARTASRGLLRGRLRSRPMMRKKPRDGAVEAARSERLPLREPLTAPNRSANGNPIRSTSSTAIGSSRTASAVVLHGSVVQRPEQRLRGPFERDGHLLHVPKVAGRTPRTSRCDVAQRR